MKWGQAKFNTLVEFSIERYDRHPRLHRGLIYVLPAVAAGLLRFSAELPSPTRVWVIVLGILTLLINAWLDYIRERSDQKAKAAELDSATRLHVTLQDALKPVAALIATMPGKTKYAQRSILTTVATQAVSGLQVLTHGISRARSVVCEIDDGGREMRCLAYTGRGDEPKPFVAGTARGDRAIASLKSAKPLFVPDLRSAPEDWEGSGEGYSTFISARIANGSYAYGMVTLDAPEAGSLGLTDAVLVSLVADLVAIAFAEAARNR